MPYNAVEKTLEAHKPQTPAGFAERSDAQVLQLFAEGKKKGSLKRKFTVVLCGLLLMLSLTTALAATVPGVNATLYKYWPQAAEALMPINASCVDQGIKMEIESAVVKDNQALVTYSLQDLEGDRINKYTESWLDEFLFAEPANGSRSMRVPLGYDEAEKKASFATGVEYYRLRDTADDAPLTIRFNTLFPTEATDLHPLLKEYGSAVETTAVPEGAVAARSTVDTMDEVPEQELREMKILDHTKGPDLEINEYVRLTGIAWIDGKLHVQIHCPDLHLQNYGSKNVDTYYPVSAYVSIPTPLDYDISGGSGVMKEITVVRWNERGTDDEEYAEYIISCDPAEVDQADFLLLVRRYDKMIEGNWEVTVPYRMISYQ